MKYKISEYYEGDKGSVWRRVLGFPIVLLLWLANYPPTREDMYK